MSLFTIRNGNLAKDDKVMSYAEKIMLVQVDQVTPMHFHWSKMEDIINRGGGRLVIQLYMATSSDDLDRKTEVCVSIDGISHAALTGQYAFISTALIPLENCRSLDRTPYGILAGASH